MKTVTKQGTMLCLLTLLFFRVSAVPPESTVRGAASKAELTDALFQAIKNNQFETLLNYLPDDHHLEILRTTTNAIDKVFYDGLTSESVRDQAQENFRKVIKNGIDNEINWSSLELMEKRPKPNNSLKDIHTTVLVMEDNKEVPLSFSFDSVEILDRWFIIQGISPDVTSQIGFIID